MPSYVVTGVSRGIGYEFLRQLSADPNDTVIGIVRDKAATVEKVSANADLKGRPNIHILEADMTSYDALKSAAEDTAKITGGTLDYLIANAGYVSQFDGFDPIGVLGADHQKLEGELRKLIDINLIGNIHLYNLFVPLILQGQAKKVVVLTSGHADLDLVNKYGVDIASLYSISKAAMNMATAKFSAQYKEDGVLFLSLSPGMVEVGHYTDMTQEQMAGMQRTLGKFRQYAPHFSGPDTPENSVRAMRAVWENATAEKDGGEFISQFGNKQWL